MASTTPDIITVIINDHNTVKGLWKQFQSTTLVEEQQKLAWNIIRELSIHASCEEEVLYPAIKSALPDGDQISSHSLQEHHQAKEDLYMVDQMNISDPMFVPTLTKAVNVCLLN